ARLHAVAVNGQRLTPQGLAHEAGQHHAIVPALARSGGVEEPDHDGRQAEFPMVDEGQDLIHSLGGRVAPTQLPGRAEDAVVVLLEGPVLVLPVDLAGGADEDLGSAGGGRLEEVFGAADVGDHRLQRAIDDQLDADGGGQVVDHVRLGDQPPDQVAVENRAL